MTTKTAHLVGLKVLRLSRPELRRPDITESHDLPSQLLSLPSSFGSVYVGETFSALLSTNAACPEDTTVDVRISISIQLPSQTTVNLLHPDEVDASYTLKPGEGHQHVVHYEAKETGTHALVATVNYTPVNPASETPSQPITFRKSYRLSAAPALNVKTKLTPIDGGHLVEAQIENVTHETMVLESTQLLPPSEWVSQPLAPESIPPLLPKHVYQAAYIVSRESPDLKNLPAIGSSKLMLGWRREPLGERGWLTTGSIKPEK